MTEQKNPAARDLRDPELVHALMRKAAMIGRRNCARLAALYEEASKNGAPPERLENPDAETAAMFDEERSAISVLFGLFSGRITEGVVPGWAGRPMASWLAGAIPGDLYVKTSNFEGGTDDAAIENFLIIFSNVYSKFATWEQLMKKFNEPVDEADFEAMIATFANLAAGKSTSVDLPEVFQRMDFSDAEKAAKA